MNLYPKHSRSVIGNDGKTHALSPQIAPYSLSTSQLVVDVGEGGGHVNAKRVTLDLDPRDLKSDADVIAALDLALDAGAPYMWVKCSNPACERWRLDSNHDGRDTNRYVEIRVPMGTGEYGGDTIPDKTKPLCEECFIAALDARMAEHQKVEKAKREADEAKLYARGMRWAVDAWIHPKRGGDDYQVTYYFAEQPDMAAVKAKIRRISMRDDDVAPPRALKPVHAATVTTVPLDLESDARRWLQKRCVGNTLAREKGKHASLDAGWWIWRKQPFTPEVKAKVLAQLERKGLKPEQIEFANEMIPQSKAALTVAEVGIKVGAFVKWTGRDGTVIEGTVLRISTKTISVRTAEGKEWRLGLGGKIEVPTLKIEGMTKAVEKARQMTAEDERKRKRSEAARKANATRKAAKEAAAKVAAAATLPRLTEVQAPVLTGTPTADGGMRVTCTPIYEALESAGWFYPASGQRPGLDVMDGGNVAPIAKLVFKDEDMEGDMRIGPLFAQTRDGKEMRPLIARASGHPEWFPLSEAKKIANLLRLPLEEC